MHKAAVMYGSSSYLRTYSACCRAGGLKRGGQLRLTSCKALFAETTSFSSKLSTMIVTVKFPSDLTLHPDMLPQTVFMLNYILQTKVYKICEAAIMHMCVYTVHSMQTDDK